MGKIRVLVVDDSAFIRRVVSDVLNSDNDIDVVAVARNGEDALTKIEAFRPDVITLDIEMPKMDGLTALSHIMDKYPTPVVMVSSLDRREADVVVKALEKGAVDFISKPARVTEMGERVDELVGKVKTAAGVDVARLKLSIPGKSYITKSLPKPSIDKQFKIITIGASTGGPKALFQIISDLPLNLHAAVLLVQHMGAGFTSSFAARLDSVSTWDVVEAQEGDELHVGKMILAPGDYHMEVEKKIINGQVSGIVHLNQNSKVNNVRPAIDVTMRSVAEAYGTRNLGVVLTGMGSDGAIGLQDIKKVGGKTIAEDKSTCIVYGMPKACAELGVVDTVAPLPNIVQNIINKVS